jgi:hypothetical protein
MGACCTGCIAGRGFVDVGDTDSVAVIPKKSVCAGEAVWPLNAGVLMSRSESFTPDALTGPWPSRRLPVLGGADMECWFWIVAEGPSKMSSEGVLPFD